MAGGLANYDGAVQLSSSAEVAAWVGLVGLVGCTSAAGAQGQSILSTVQPQQLPAIDLLHISNLTFDHCIYVYMKPMVSLQVPLCTSILTSAP